MPTPVNQQRPRIRKQRAEATRQRILRSAYNLFAEFGYQATTMAAVADDAGVAVQTVYFVFHTKAELLQEVCKSAVLGEDGTAPEEQEWYEHLEQDGPRALLERFIENVSPIAQRAAPLTAVVRAVPEPEVAAVYEESQRRRREAYRRTIRLLAEKGGLRRDLDEGRATDILMVLASPETFQLLVNEYRWPIDAWTAWVVEVLAQQLLVAE